MSASIMQDNGTASRALIRGQTLVLTLKDAVNPVVWQMDLTHVRSSALGVVAQGDNWQVRCKTDDGVTQDIAIYRNRDQAVAVLTLVHDALAETSGARIKKSDVTYPRHILLAATALVLLIVLTTLLMKLVPPPVYKNVTAATKHTAAPRAVGVPQNADDLLENRGPTP